MNFDFQPSGVVISFFFIKKFIFLEILTFLSLARVVLGQGWVRLPAALSFVLCLLGLLTIFAPLLNLATISGIAEMSQIMLWGSGMVYLLAPALLLIGTGLSRSRPAPWIELLGFLATAGLIGLWIATLF